MRCSGVADVHSAHTISHKFFRYWNGNSVKTAERDEEKFVKGAAEYQRLSLVCCVHERCC